MIGMAPTVWGPLFWTTMHVVTLGYSPNPSKDEQTAAIQFFRSLEAVIPCPICRAHYSKFLKEAPIENYVSSRDVLIKWLFDIHNHVNEQLGKPKVTWQQFIDEVTKLHNMSHLSFYEAPSTLPSLAVAAIAGLLVGITGTFVYNHIVKK
jgi:FAD-linked sulfhydryl oxidase